MGYYEVVRGLEKTFNMRLPMVKLAQEKGICESARVYDTTRKTVRKWVSRYRQGGLQGLTDRETQNIFLIRPQKR